MVTSAAAKRRIVRSLALLPLLMCLFGWVSSYVHTDVICYTASKRDWSAGNAIGEVVLWSGASTRSSSGWNYVHTHPDWEIGELYAGLPDWHLLGAHFFYGSHPYSPDLKATLVAVPFWMLSTAAALAPALLWWRTRKRQSARGFPIEGSKVGT
jgi:hypothetical protein